MLYNMEKIANILIVFFIILGIVLFMFIFIIGCYYLYNINNKDNLEITPIDTTYNLVILDTISQHIKEKDSVIVRLKYKLEYEIEEVKNDNDTAAVNRFYKLVNEN